MRILRVLALAAMVLAAPSTASAGIDKAGTTAAGFLSVGSGADALGMGGAALGFGGGIGAAAWNVASLSGINGTEYVFSHASLSGASPQDWVAAGGRFGASRTRWGVTGLYQGDGAFEGRDAFNNPTSSFNASSMALGVQLAQPVGASASLGLGMKYVSEKLGDVTGGGVTFDAGARFRAGALGIGLAAQNAFGKMSYGGATYDFPTNYGAGLAYTLPLSGVTLAVDANFPSAYYTDVRGGIEWRYHDRLALRGGYRKELSAAEGEPLGGPTFGMGAGANGFWFDYGFLTGGASGSGQHRMGLTYHPGFMNGGADATVPEAPRPARAARVAPAPLKPRPTPASVPHSPLASLAPAPNKSTPIAPIAPAPQTPKPAPPPPPAKVEAPVAVVMPAPVKIEKPAVAPPPPAKVETPVTVATPAPVKIEQPAVAPPPPAKVETPVAVVMPAPVKIEKPAAVETPAPKREQTDEMEAPPVLVPPPAVVKPAVVAPPVAKTPAPAPEAAASRPGKVKVKAGETMAEIAKRWGTTVPAIMMENNLVSEKVKPGQTLKIPRAR